MSSPKAANSMGFISLPDNKLGASGYKAIWNLTKCYVPFTENEMYVFEVDEEVLDEVTCEVIVSGGTARIKKTKNQKYYGNFVDGVLVINEGVN